MTKTNKSKKKTALAEKPLRIKVIGGGYLGKQIAKALGAELDTRMVYTVQDAQEMMYVHHDNNHLKFDVVINAIGRTGVPNVDWCDLPENQRDTFMSNVLVPMQIAEAAKREGVKMVHISSGCIYDGVPESGAYTEEDVPNFETSFYSFTKKTAERAIGGYDNTLILRIRMPLGEDHGDRNLISKLLKYEEIIDTDNSITTISELLRSLKELIALGETGIYNIVSPEPITHRRILEIYDEVMGTEVSKSKKFIDPKALKVATPRTNTVLSAKKLASKVTIPSVEDAVRHELNLYKENDK